MFMQISSRFTIALHIFSCIIAFGKDTKITSDFLASSINVNAVTIRNVLGQLRNAGLIQIARGSGGAQVTRSLNEITLLQVYNAVESVENGELFHFHDNPNPKCTVGKNIHLILDDKLQQVQNAMENELRSITLEDIKSSTEKYV